ncbi:MAG: LpxL/LpxP family Kdo(2)-lipid IV(A) lauroyl/palmitoleoyl acyltransferase [Pseudomonadales bacterium]
MSKRKPRASIYSPRFWGSWVVVGLGWLLARLPLPWLMGFGQGLGAAAYQVARRRRQITEVNLGLCFPSLSAGERQQLAKRSFVHAGVTVAELTVAWLNPRRPLDHRFTVIGVEHLTAAQAEGRGVILLGGHFSCMDIVSQAIARRVKIDVMYRENKNPVWEWLQLQGRRHYFDAVIERDDTRTTLRRIKAGHTIWYAPDQDYGRRHSVFAPFFGVPAASITATARLARLNHSPVVFMSQHRDLESLTWEIRFHPPLTDFPSGDDVADAARINGVIEAAIRRHPEQYLWAHRRFKTRPPGEPGPYR